MVHPFVQRLREEFERRGTGGGCLLHRNMARNHLHGFPVRFIKSPIHNLPSRITIQKSPPKIRSIRT
ncbi:MAG: hypothetical protein ACLR8Y_06335 [Alistipes indistinctus]